MGKATYTPAVRQALQKLPRTVARQIMANIAAYLAKPDAPKHNARPLCGRTGTSLRVGDWRVILQGHCVLALLRTAPPAKTVKVWTPSWT